MDKIICMGKNYLDHANELGDAVPSKPVVFMKPPSVATIVSKWGEEISVSLPRNKGEVHPECEIVLKINAKGQFDAVTLGLDLTLREVQSDLKKKGLPWELGKVFPHSAVIGPWISLTEFQDYLDKEFTLSLQGKVTQRSKGAEMRFLPDYCLQWMKDFFSVCSGDVLFTGTPAGVCGVNPNQTVELSWGQGKQYRVHFI